MNESEGIKVAIVDDHKEWIDSLLEELSSFPEVDVCGYATQYKQACELLLNDELDLVFLDVEMPCKNGFELLNESRKKGSSFSVIFYTSYDKYMIQALRESAFDYIVKPVRSEELKNAIDRFKEQRTEQSQTTESPLFPGAFGTPEIIALPTHLGLRFVDKNRILLFRRITGSLLEKSSWEAMLTDSSAIKLGANTSAERITQLLSNERFLQINQSCIINLSYMNTIEFKTRTCLLIPPFDKMSLTVSRAQLSKFKEVYEVF